MEQYRRQAGWQLALASPPSPLAKQAARLRLSPGGSHARRRISLAALGMHAWDTSFRFIWGGPPLAVGVHDYYAHARDVVMPGMRNMPIGGKACMPGMRLTNAACTPYPKRLTNAACTPYLRGVHPGGACMPMDYDSVSPTRRARHTSGACTLVESARPWIMKPTRRAHHTLSVSPTRRAHHTLLVCTLVVRACPWILKASHQRGVLAIP